MAAVAVVHDVVKTIVPTAATNMQVTVVCASLAWCGYCRVIRNGVQVDEPKVQPGKTMVFNILAGDRVDVWPTGTGTLSVTTVAN